MFRKNVPSRWTSMFKKHSIRWLPSLSVEPTANHAKLWSITCHMGSHTQVLTASQCRSMHSNPSQTGQYSIYLPRRDERLSLPWCGYITVGSLSVSFYTARPQIRGSASRSMPVNVSAFAGTHCSTHEGMARLSWPGLPTCRQSPIHVLTRPGINFVYATNDVTN